MGGGEEQLRPGRNGGRRSSACTSRAQENEKQPEMTRTGERLKPLTCKGFRRFFKTRSTPSSSLIRMRSLVQIQVGPRGPAGGRSVRSSLHELPGHSPGRQNPSTDPPRPPRYFGRDLTSLDLVPGSAASRTPAAHNSAPPRLQANLTNAEKVQIQVGPRGPARDRSVPSRSGGRKKPTTGGRYLLTNRLRSWVG